jgi:site-specific recombinase XerD
LRLYFINFQQRTDWDQPPASPALDSAGRVDPLAALDLLRARLRTRHYSLRTETSYVDWVRRFVAYLEEHDGPRPTVTAAAVRDFLTHLAVHRRVSASTQNQAQCALLFLAREVLGLAVDGLSQMTRAKRGERLPVVLSVPEVAALLDAMHGVSRIMAGLIYGGGLRVSECCQLRVKDLDFAQGLIFVRDGKGAKDRATLLPEADRDGLQAHLHAGERLHAQDRQTGLAGVC